jgi:choline dehydrogenase-like flavoprotein
MVATDGAHFDFVIVGGGTAGNTVAGRLAENPNVNVLVVEAGVGNSHEIEEITTPSMWRYPPECAEQKRQWQICNETKASVRRRTVCETSSDS